MDYAGFLNRVESVFLLEKYLQTLYAQLLNFYLIGEEKQHQRIYYRSFPISMYIHWLTISYLIQISQEKEK